MAIDFSIDDLDFFIIDQIILGVDSIRKIAKKRFSEPPECFKNSIQRNKFWVKCDKRIRDRLKKLSNYGLVFIDKNGGNVPSYHLLKDTCVIKKMVFCDRCRGRGYNLKINGSWVIFQK